MKTIITCKNCGQQIEVSEALRHQLEEELLTAERQQHKKEIAEIEKNARDMAQKSVREELELKMKLLSEEAEERKKRAKELEEQIIHLSREMRKIQEEAEKQRIIQEKRLLEEQEKIKNDLRKRIEDEHKLKDLEKDKKILDQAQALEELKRKLEQGSQQLQGEVLELEIEAELRKNFPHDEVKEVGKGVKGGDIVQTLIDKSGTVYGTILWETKNAKWSQGWIAKLRDDQRNIKADVAVLVCVDMPKNTGLYAYREGIWICNKTAYIELAYSLHYALFKEFQARGAAMNKAEKMEELYRYITGIEFRQRVEAIMESYGRFREEIERERKFMELKWSRQEKELVKLMNSTLGVYGELQAVTNRALPELQHRPAQDDL